jgi:hypothetical protein
MPGYAYLRPPALAGVSVRICVEGRAVVPSFRRSAVRAWSYESVRSRRSQVSAHTSKPREEIECPRAQLDLWSHKTARIIAE